MTAKEAALTGSTLEDAGMPAPASDCLNAVSTRDLLPERLQGGLHPCHREGCHDEPEDSVDNRIYWL